MNKSSLTPAPTLEFKAAGFHTAAAARGLIKMHGGTFPSGSGARAAAEAAF